MRNEMSILSNLAFTDECLDKNEVKRRAEALTCNKVAGKPEGRNGNNKTVSAISLFRYAEGVTKSRHERSEFCVI